MPGHPAAAIAGSSRRRRLGRGRADRLQRRMQQIPASRSANRFSRDFGSGLTILGADHDKLAWLQLSTASRHFDIAMSGESRLHDNIGEPAVFFDLDPRSTVGGE